MAQMERLHEIGVMMVTHISKGYSLDVRSWLIELHDDYRYTVEGTLVSLATSVCARLFPCGKYTCGCCMQEQMMSRKDVGYWDDDVTVIVCRECRNIGNKIMLPVVTSFYDVHPSMFMMMDKEMVTVRDRRKSEEEQREKIHAMGYQFADTLGGTYLQNMCLKDVREYFLAKRVVNKWKRMREQRRRKYVAAILYEHAGVGKDAAWVHAHRVMI